MNFFKKLHNLHRLCMLNKLCKELCGKESCRNCECYLNYKIHDFHSPLCAQYYVIEEALKQWGYEED